MNTVLHFKRSFLVFAIAVVFLFAVDVSFTNAQACCGTVPGNTCGIAPGKTIYMTGVNGTCATTCPPGTNEQRDSNSCGAGNPCCVPLPACTGACQPSCNWNQHFENAMSCTTAGQVCCLPNDSCCIPGTGTSCQISGVVTAPGTCINAAWSCPTNLDSVWAPVDCSVVTGPNPYSGNCCVPKGGGGTGGPGLGPPAIPGGGAMTPISSIYKLTTPLGTITTVNSISDYIGKLITFFGMGIGVTALMVMLYGAILFMTSGGNTSRRQKGIDKMKKAIYGIFIFFGMYIILNTINPVLVGGVNPVYCGDGVKSASEQCDLLDFGPSGAPTCASIDPTKPDGEVDCVGCQYSADKCFAGSPPSPPPFCGDNSVNTANEECDGTDMGVATDCNQLTPPMLQGTLTCFPSTDPPATRCKYNRAACPTPPPPPPNPCGNGTIEAGTEDCDGNNLGTTTSGTPITSCADVPGLGVGPLTCIARNTPGQCTYDVSGCVPPEVCGNGFTRSGEICDPGGIPAGTPPNIPSATCATEVPGSSGTLLCNATCDGYITTGCLLPPQCGGNTTVDNPPEECDVAAGPPSSTGVPCDSAILTQPTPPWTNSESATCTVGCKWDTSRCNTCGNGTSEGTEVCDGSSWAGGAPPSCSTAGCGGGCVLTCNADCLGYTTTTCPVPPPSCGVDMNTELCTPLDPGFGVCNAPGCLTCPLCPDQRIIAKTINNAAGGNISADFAKATLAVQNPGCLYDATAAGGYNGIGLMSNSMANWLHNTSGLCNFPEDSTFNPPSGTGSGNCVAPSGCSYWDGFLKVDAQAFAVSPAYAQYRLKKAVCLFVENLKYTLSSGVCGSVNYNVAAKLFDSTACWSSATCINHASCFANNPALYWECTYQDTGCTGTPPTCGGAGCLPWEKTDIYGSKTNVCVKCDPGFNSVRQKIRNIQSCEGQVNWPIL